MPKVTPQHELDRLVELIATQQDGMGVEALLHTLGASVQRRTLQRRLALLVGQGRIQMRGEARSAHYVVPPASAVAGLQALMATVQASGEVYVPTSPEGEEIKAYVRQPRQLRQPVGYKLAFLEQYRPNQTAYLPQGLRDQLHALGRSPADQTPAGTFARDILNRLLIDLSWASSQLEGNTYSRLDTERLIEFGQAAEGKDALETQMILNHKDAIEYLVRDPEHASLTPETLIALHAFLSDGLMADPSACGRLRRRAVEIGGSVYMPVALPQRLEELFGIVIQMAAEIEDPFEQAFFLMVHLPYRQALSEVIAAIVRSGEPATPDAINARMPATVANEDQAHFVTMALSEFKALHPGNAVRFGIRPLELKAWQTRHVER